MWVKRRHQICIVGSSIVLRNVGDLTNPPNWYPEARALNRKIVFHAGPTNSGKTYHALERCAE